MNKYQAIALFFASPGLILFLFGSNNSTRMGGLGGFLFSLAILFIITLIEHEGGEAVKEAKK